MGKNSIVQGHQARKRFGQNFLSDNFYIQRIVDSIAPRTEDCMVEIGPGLGAITEHLIKAVGQLNVVELDRDLIPRLQEKFSQYDNFVIHHHDALKFDFTNLYQNDSDAQGKLRIVGNLPYNISTPLIFHLLDQREVIQDMYFMLQKEVVERICAAPGTSQYGRLSVMAQYYCQTQMLFVVPPGAFLPPPKVDSAIIRLQPHEQLPYPVTDAKQLNKIVTSAFGQRRKTLRNSLKNWINDVQLQDLGIDPQQRAENISLQQFTQICCFIEQESQN
ncbi:MAG: 16S rRNA (adenine(1518)-N(6)/adenine(1519)-N(6))-dimethyltransferase RsmA [Kangiellaceae bacterium]|nr:16S rRNA (adenine(1518)-N(6)/adenine(1519)-N(6))-dimethyltransferase RsmA [Kangiellaceae bacterium]